MTSLRSFSTLLIRYPAPAMSTKCERVFSNAMKLIIPERNQLGEGIIEACECLKACWLYLHNAEMTLDLDANEVEVKMLTSLTLVTAANAQSQSLYPLPSLQSVNPPMWTVKLPLGSS